MKKNIHPNLWGLLKSKAVLGVSAGMLMVSCGAYTGGYSETDGVYYDPNTDTCLLYTSPSPRDRG